MIFPKLACLLISISAVCSGTFAHDPSVIYADGLYWMFYTADGIGVKYSEDAINWKEGVRIFAKPLDWWKNYVPAKTDFNIWAPDITHYNGKYHLYYSVSTFGSKVSVIGLMQCTSILKGDWVDQGAVIASSTSSKYNCIDPSFIHGTAPFLVFGSFFDGIYMVRLSSATMKPNASPIKIATRNIANNAIEGACIWNGGNGYYYLFASFDKCCNGINSTYNIRYGRSQSETGPFFDKDGKSLLEGGGSILIASNGDMIGPGGESVFRMKDGGPAMAFHYYDKKNNGMATLQIKKLNVVDGWPTIY